MKPLSFNFLPILGIGGLLTLASVNTVLADADDAKPAAAEPSAATVKRNANGEMVVTVDEATQKRIKLEFASPAPADWQPEVTGYGRVLDPTPLATAMVDWATAKITAEASARENDRLKLLASQDNASARALEAAQLAADHDRLALDALKAKLTGDWGMALAGRSDLPDLVKQLAERKNSLVRLTLPAGDRVTEMPSVVKLTVFGDDAHLLAAEAIELNLGVDAQTEGQQLLLLAKDQTLPLNAAVTGHLSIAGKAASGVEVPAVAVLRHEGRGWVYLQTGGNEFTRHEIALDRMTAGGWFVDGLSATNVLVTTGAQTMLSAELSGGGFNTGTRD